MKLHLYLLVATIAFSSSIPAAADVLLYSDGAVNGHLGFDEIDNTSAATDSFTLAQQSILTAVKGIGLWTFTGTAPVSVGWGISAAPDFTNSAGGGGSPTATLTNQFLFDTTFNRLDYSIYQSTFSLPNISLPAGTYYLTLTGAMTNSASPLVGWDVNNGPSQAEEQIPLGPTISTPGEAFEIFGKAAASVPEPSFEPLLFGLFVCLSGAVARRRRDANRC